MAPSSMVVGLVAASIIALGGPPLLAAEAANPDWPCVQRKVATLTSAQMLSDQVVALDDPKIQRLAPRLVQSIDRAVGFAQSVIEYGRESGAPPKPDLAIEEAQRIRDTVKNA